MFRVACACDQACHVVQPFISWVLARTTKDLGIWTTRKASIGALYHGDRVPDESILPQLCGIVRLKSKSILIVYHITDKTNCNDGE